ncbi:hypothetical protein QQ73_20335, partial [Candidatus Endoriftia persephone str. Guaymas]|nr:hypothetical protein [Candidatus Endoriftia persephone str. Guaymas]
EWSSKNQPTKSLRRQLAGLKSDLDAVNKEMADMQEQKRLASMSQESQAAIKSARSELTQLRDDLSTVDTEIAAKSTQLLGMDPVNTTAEMDQLGAELVWLRKRQRDLTKAVQESETAYNRVLSAGVESTGSTKAQQQQLATQMDLVKEILQDGLALFASRLHFVDQVKCGLGLLHRLLIVALIKRCAGRAHLRHHILESKVSLWCAGGLECRGGGRSKCVKFRCSLFGREQRLLLPAEQCDLRLQFLLN